MVLELIVLLFLEPLKRVGDFADAYNSAPRANHDITLNAGIPGRAGGRVTKKTEEVLAKAGRR